MLINLILHPTCRLAALAVFVFTIRCGSTQVSPQSQRPLGTSVGSQGIENLEKKQKQSWIAWNEPIRLEKLGLAPNANIEGKTLKSIISSLTFGRDDHQLCSACHNRTESAGNYGLDKDKNRSFANLDPWKIIGMNSQRSWAGKGGWAEQFAANSTKPPLLRSLMDSWREGGYQVEP